MRSYSFLLDGDVAISEVISALVKEFDIEGSQALIHEHHVHPDSFSEDMWLYGSYLFVDGDFNIHIGITDYRTPFRHSPFVVAMGLRNRFSVRVLCNPPDKFPGIMDHSHLLVDMSDTVYHVILNDDDLNQDPPRYSLVPTAMYPVPLPSLHAYGIDE